MIVPPLETSAQFAVEKLLNPLPEGLLVAFFAWAILRFLPRQNSRTRFAVWFFALLVLVILPVVEGVASRVGIPAPASYFSNDATGVLARLAESASNRATLKLPSEWAFAIFSVWSVITFLLLARILVGLWNLRELRKSCSAVDLSSLDPSLSRLVSELNGEKSLASRTIALATSNQVRVPTALGLGRPMVVLPTWALRELPPDDLAIVLRHEFAHLARWDDWTNLFQKTIRALFFFHPAVWWIERRLSVEREMACDDVVLAQTANPTGYADCLVSLLERSLTQRGWTMAQALVHRAREASERLKQILDTNRPSSTQTAKPALGMIGAFALVCIVALPHSPQIVSFERTPQRDWVASNKVAPPAPAVLNVSLTKLQPPVAATNTNAGSPLDRGRVALQNLPRASRGDRVNAAEPFASGKTSTLGNDSAAERRPILAQDVSPGFASKDDMSPVGTAQPPAPTFVSFDDDTQPTFLFVNATQELDPESGALVWRVQVWQITLTPPVWKHVQVPPAHST